MERPIRVLMITSAWPPPGAPSTVHFIARQVRFLREAGVDVDVFHFNGRRQPWRYAAAWAKARWRLHRRSYDLVHAQFGQSGLLALPRRLPLVVTLRGSDLLGIVSDSDGRYTWIGRVGCAATRLVARHADAVVIVSEHMRAKLPPYLEAEVIPSGLDLSLFRPMPQKQARERLGLPTEVPVVLFAGRPSQARKRYQLAAEAVEIVRRTLPAEFIVAWGVPHTEVPIYMNAADALIFTSMQEGSPNVVKEALACGLPVVSVPVGDVAERIGEVEGCSLCPDARPETIARALEEVLRRRRRVDATRVISELDEHRQTARLINIYRRLLRDTSEPREVY
jgi:teichuronic acid biosynthesis glycosyltransferase TuaC